MIDGSPHPGSGRVATTIRLISVFVLLYLFLVGVKALETGISAFGEDFAQDLFDNVKHPIAGLMAGLLATVLVQSSSVTTSTIVGLVGAGALPLAAAVPMVMGANIGTTITNTLVSLGHVRRGPEFRRAFAGATVHDFFNLLTVLVALPLEVATGFLTKGARFLTDLLVGNQGLNGVAMESPISEIVAAPLGALEGAVDGLSPIFAGSTLLVVGMVLIFFGLAFITKTMRVLMRGRIEAALTRMLDRGAGTGALLLGLVVTMLVQSSSITTAILIPLLAAGIISIQNAYPVTLGANLGTTITALLASLASVSPDALTIALVHSLFNGFGIVLFYPVPFLRRIPITLATRLAELTQRSRMWVAVYVGGVFVVLPLLGIFLLG